MLLQKIKAGALQLTLHIVIIVGLLLTAFVLLTHIHNRFKLQASLAKETINNCNRGIHFTIKNNLILKDTLTINLDDESYKSLKVHRGFWGAFEKISVDSKIKTHRFKKQALVGSSQLELDRPSLYLEETKTPLVLVGNTKLDGLIYLPLQGVKPGYISGESYNGTKLLYGSSKVIDAFPKLSNDWFYYIKTVHLIGTRADDSQFLQIENDQFYSNSFSNPTQIVYQSGKIDLGFITLTGNVIVQSQTEISVDASSNLKDVILIAPKITIKDGTKGNFQVIASKTITVGNNVRLSYPSSLILHETCNSQPLDSGSQIQDIPIEIGKNSCIAGQIIFIGTPKTNNYNPQLYISENSTVTGEVYCNQNLELLGTVDGTVFSHSFIVNNGGSIYQNHLYNASISVKELPKEYVGLLIKDSQKAVAKWLY